MVVGALYRVEVTSNWVPEAESDVEVLIGYISGLGGKRGVVTCEDSEEISFPICLGLSLEGYRPHLDDWVKVCFRVCGCGCDVCLGGVMCGWCDVWVV